MLMILINKSDLSLAKLEDDKNSILPLKYFKL